MNKKKISVMILAFIIGSTFFMPKSYLSSASNKVYAATINENLPPITNIDLPEANSNNNSSSIHVSGWALNKSGIKEVQIFIDGRFKGYASIGNSRPDIKLAFPSYGQTNSGYSYTMDSKSIYPGIHYLTVKALGNDGTVSSSSININVNRPMPLIHIDTPKGKTYAMNKILISGWSLNYSRVSSVDIFIDGNKASSASLGIPRPDVKKVFPFYNDITSGFTYTLDASKLSYTDHKITLRSNGNDGSYAEQSITLNKPEYSTSMDTSNNEQSTKEKSITLADWALNPLSINLATILVDNVQPQKAISEDLASNTNKTYSDSSSNSTTKCDLNSTGNSGQAVSQSETPKNNIAKTNDSSVIAVTSITLNGNTHNLTVGDTDILTANIYPANASNKLSTWTSSNSDVAKVDNTGKVTTIGAGTANITATTANGGKTATCTITVANKKGYVYNPELQIDLNVRSAPNLKSSTLGFMYNYEKFDIMGSEIDDKGNVWDKIVYRGNTAYISDAYVQHYTSPSDNVINTASTITKAFESTNSSETTESFDGTSLSPDYIKFYISNGTLQPLLNRMDRENNDKLKSIFMANYDTLHNMILDTPENELNWVNSITDSSDNITEPWHSQLSNLFNNNDFMSIEKDAQVYTIKQAMIICDKYNLKTVRGFALAFDIAAQNGGITSDAAKIIDAAVQNNPNISEKELLQIIADTSANTASSNPENIRARETAIVNGHGMVHGTMLYLDSDYNLSDKLWR